MLGIETEHDIYVLSEDAASALRYLAEVTPHDVSTLLDLAIQGMVAAYTEAIDEMVASGECEGDVDEDGCDVDDES